MSEEKPLQLPQPPPLCSAVWPKPNYAELQVFGFPFTRQDVRAYSKRHNLSSGEWGASAYQQAWAAVKRALPKHVERAIMFQGVGCQCIVIGSNISPKQLERAQNIDLIRKFQDVLQVDAQPGWFHLAPL